MSASNHSSTVVPGTWLVIAFVAFAVGLAMWNATRRTALVDDALPTAASDWPDMRIDINRANAAELASLPGLGERLAQRIIEDRENTGRFANIDDLGRVPGIGDAMIERLRPYVVAE
jgi:competence protein ComEA